MKKIFFLLSVISVALFASPVHAYVIKHGDTLSGIAKFFQVPMSELVVDNNISNPNLIYAGSKLYISTEEDSSAYLPGFQNGFEPQLGYSVVSRYKTTLASSMTTSQTTVPATTVTTFDGHTLTMADLGDKVFLTLEPGTNREEIVVCTGISGTSWTGCTRGLAFYGTTETAVAANKKAHNAGSVIVMSNTHYVYEQVVDKDTAQTVSGPLTFTSSSPNIYYAFPVVSSTGYTGLPTQNGQLSTKYYVDQVGAGGFTASNVSTTYGIQVFGTSPETLGVNASSTTGMAFDSSGALYQKTSSTAGILTDSSGLYVDSSYVVLDSDTTSTPTASKIPIAGSDAKLNNGWVSGSSYTGTAGENINGTTTPQVVAIKNSDSKFWKADANNTDLVNAVGFVVDSISTDGTGKIVTSGYLEGFTGLTVGSQYFVQDTAGTIGTTPSTSTTIPVGYSISSTTLKLEFGNKRALVQPSNVSRTSAGTTQSTYTVGFRPSRIVIYASASGDANTNQGMLEYFGTTVVFSNILIDAGSFGTLDFAEVENMPAQSSIAGTPSAANYSQISVQLNSITTTGAVFDYIYTCDGSGCGNSKSVSSQKILFEE